MGCIDPNGFYLLSLPIVMGVAIIFYVAFRVAMRPPVQTTVPIERATPVLSVVRVLH